MARYSNIMSKTALSVLNYEQVNVRQDLWPFRSFISVDSVFIKL
jgi:hypothetical protein